MSTKKFQRPVDQSKSLNLEKNGKKINIQSSTSKTLILKPSEPPRSSKLSSPRAKKAQNIPRSPA
jgi:hypothetical protein